MNKNGAFFHYKTNMINALQSAFPYLDYISRISLNMALNKTDRIQTPLSQLVIKQVEINLNVAHLKKGILQMDKLHGQAKVDAFINYFQNTLRNNLCVCQHNSNFRRAVLEKLNKYNDINCSDYTDDILIDTVIPICKDILYKLETKYYYLYPISLPKVDEGWSPVDV
jgi:hypothetical protein